MINVAYEYHLMCNEQPELEDEEDEEAVGDKSPQCDRVIWKWKPASQLDSCKSKKRGLAQHSVAGLASS